MSIADWLLSAFVFACLAIAMFFAITEPVMTYFGYTWHGRIRRPPVKHECILPSIYNDVVYHAPEGTTFTCRRCKRIWTLGKDEYRREWLDQGKRIKVLEQQLRLED